MTVDLEVLVGEVDVVVRGDVAQEVKPTGHEMSITLMRRTWRLAIKGADVARFNADK